MSSGVPAYMPPRVANTYAFLPVSRPTGPVAVYRNVMPARATWSKYALSVDGTPKLYIGSPKHDHVGALQFVDQRIGVRGDGLLRGVALLGLGQECAEPFGGEVRHGVDGDVADDHRRAGIVRAPRGDELVGKPGRLAAVAQTGWR